MPAEVVACPACANQVRVPETLLGQAVRCPKCKAYFRAPTRDASGFLGTPEVLDNPPPAAQRDRPALDTASLFLPGILLLLVSTIGFLVTGFQTFQNFQGREVRKQRLDVAIEQYEQLTKQKLDDEQRKAADAFVDTIPTVMAIAFAVSVFPLLGAFAMLTMRYWGLAVVGSVFALINLGSCCCIMSAPVGIYCLIKLFDPEVRALFSHR